MNKDIYKIVSELGHEWQTKAANKLEEPMRTEELNKLLMTFVYYGHFDYAKLAVSFLNRGFNKDEIEKIFNKTMEKNDLKNASTVASMAEEPKRTKLMEIILEKALELNFFCDFKLTALIINEFLISDKISDILAKCILKKGWEEEAIKLANKMPEPKRNLELTYLLRICVNEGKTKFAKDIAKLLNRKLHEEEIMQIISIIFKNKKENYLDDMKEASDLLSEIKKVESLENILKEYFERGELQRCREVASLLLE